MNNQKPNWKQFLKKLLPIFTKIGSIIYNYLLQRVKIAEIAKETTKLELEYKHNEEMVKKANKDKSNIDIVMDAIDEGRRDTDRK